MKLKILFEEIKSFILHLRLPYQVLLLSGPYLLGGVLSQKENVATFLIQFFNVHLLLYGGSTVYNSYYDKDEGPIGGLKSPPKMKNWMLYASIILMIFGISIAFLSSTILGYLSFLGILLGIAYSHPNIRTKSKPLLSTITIGLSMLIGVFLGFFAFGGKPEIYLYLGGIGSTLIILSLYPVSQIYQIKDDKKRGDITFAIKYGVKNIRKFFAYSFYLGLIFVVYSLMSKNILFAIALLLLGIFGGAYTFYLLKHLTGVKKEYGKVMQIKFILSICFNLFLLLMLILIL
ncbi:UbiA prenyltransferase family protein [Candidatus Pacearchaeota archaeon]|nr:UbiA prenyltransferase family protein [Candidatus Pacearchaeota archaeon]